MIKEPWKNKNYFLLVTTILRSYQETFDEPLLIVSGKNNLAKNQAEMLFKMHDPVLTHDINKDPCISYVNLAALQLWSRDWDKMIGMPSRLTAPEEEQEQRIKTLKTLKVIDSIDNYQGIRINSKGEKFMIAKVRIWTMKNKEGEICGQAATFKEWWWI